MILFGGTPERLTFGAHGITPAQIVALGGEDSPLLNDIDPGDDATELLWVLLTPLPSSGTTEADDLGYYALTGAAGGTYEQDYRILALPATGSPYAGEATITTVVGTSAAVTLASAAGTAAFGAVSATGGATVTLGSAAGTSAVGTVSALAGGNAAVSLGSAAGTAAIGTVSATGGASVSLVGVAATAAAGTVSAVGEAGGSAAVTLPSAATAASVGTISATATRNAAVTLPSVLATGSAGIIYVGALAPFRASAPPIGHGPALATRKPPTLRRRAPNLSTRTR